MKMTPMNLQKIHLGVSRLFFVSFKWYNIIMSNDKFNTVVQIKHKPVHSDKKRIII